MNEVVIIFMIVATIFALASLGYVGVDIVLELLHREKPQEEKKEEVKEEPVVVVVPEPVVEEEPVEVMPEIVEHIDAQEADEMISDQLAMSTVRYESPAGHGKQGIINIGLLDRCFEAGDVITLSVLKERGLMSKKVGRMKVLADGYLNKPLTIKSESYSIEAIKMIELTGGTVIILRD
jgi:ribosomal protein L18E